MARSWLKRLDEGWYRVERALCVALLVAMAGVVFLDAVHRQVANEGRLDRFFAQLLGPGGGRLGSALFVALVAWVLLYGALRTARLKAPLASPRAALYAVAGVVLGYGALRLLVFAFPNGLIWAQTFGLCGMLWVGFLGASMATKEGSHLTLEIMEFVWRGKAKARVGRVGALTATLFCALLGYLSARQVGLEYAEWAESDGAVGIFTGFEVPRFAVFAVLPCCFAVMGLRFLGRVLGPEEEEKPPSITPVDLDASAGEG